MKQPKKWGIGPMVVTYGAFEHAVHNNRMLFVMGFFKGRPTSSKVVGNMSYLLVTHLIRQGRINHAIQTEEYRDWLRAQLLGEGEVEWTERQERRLLLASNEDPMEVLF